MNTSDELKKLLKLWAVLLDKDPRSVMYDTMRELKIETFKNNEQAQRLAVTYLKHKLERDDE